MTLAIGAGLAEGRHLQHHQFGIETPQFLDTEVIAIQRAGPEILDQNIELADPLLDQILRFALVQIECDAEFVAPQRAPVQTDAIALRAHLAAGIAASGQFDLDHLRAIIPQNRGGQGRGDHSGNIENPNT